MGEVSFKKLTRVSMEGVWLGRQVFRPKATYNKTIIFEITGGYE